MNRLRACVIRWLLGVDDMNKVLNGSRTRAYADLIMFVAERIAKDSKTYTDEFLSQKFGSFEPSFLAACIEVNKNLSEQQKVHIKSILQSPQAPDTSYLG